MSLRDSLLRALDGRAGEAISGETLAERLGVSRTAVWKQIKALKEAGLPLESIGRQGYRFNAPFDKSLISYRAPKGITAHYHLTTASTQLLAKAGAAAGLPEGHLWISEIQTKGRGRLDRAWESSYGGLWFSLLLRPVLSPARMAALTLVTGLALREAVETMTAQEVKLKWPNDLLVSRKKVAGILTEMSGQMDRTDWLVIGIGVNVNNNLSPELAARAGTLHALTGQFMARARILDAFLAAFRPRYDQFCRKGFGSFRDDYWKHYYSPEGPINLQTSHGMITGKAVGIDAQGAVMIESRRKIQAFSEGEIVL